MQAEKFHVSASGVDKLLTQARKTYVHAHGFLIGAPPQRHLQPLQPVADRAYWQARYQGARVAFRFVGRSSSVTSSPRPGFRWMVTRPARSNSRIARRAACSFSPRPARARHSETV